MALKIYDRVKKENGTMMRQVILKFQHRDIYGQTVHNTKSSLLIKLCAAGWYFNNGLSITVDSPHSIHYRDDYNFKFLAATTKSISLGSFVLFSDLVRESNK